MCYKPLNVNRRTAAATPKNSARPYVYPEIQHNSLKIKSLRGISSQLVCNHILSEKLWGEPQS